MKVDKVISEDEAALYDRQIRLWGIDAQRRLLSSRVLLINMSGLGAEIAKNLVLSGINSLTIMDWNNVQDNDFKTNFLIGASSLGKKRAESTIEALQILNPMVKIVADSSRIEDKEDEFFSDNNFDIICALINDVNYLTKLNEIARKNNVMFLSGFVFGLYGQMFVDFNDYKYIIEAPKIIEESAEKKTLSGQACSINQKTNDDKSSFEEKNIQFKSFQDYLNDYDKYFQSITPNKLKRLSKIFILNFLVNKFNQIHSKQFDPSSSEDITNIIALKNEELQRLKLNPELLDDSYFSCLNFNEQPSVNAILGGVVAQEIIKAISKKNEPVDNLFIFDGNVMNGETFKI